MNGPVLVCYDVFDDGRRNRLRAALEEVANRFQKSGWLIPDAAGLDAHRVAAALESLLAPIDRLRIYAPCPACARQVRTVPAGPPLVRPAWVAD
ncbi:CRISPR-associated endonuclease Cas2 [Spirillospora sp. NPDC127506]|jgi:CRISPR-associated endonuclease Cas2